MCRTKEKRVTRPASLSLLNPVHGAQVAPQRCPILHDGKKHFYDTICIRFMSMYNCCAEGVQFAATEVFSFLRRHCSVLNGAGVQRERYNHSVLNNHIRNLGYEEHAIHTGPLIRRESVYKNDLMEDRKRLFNALFNFARKLDFKYICPKIKKSECSDVVSMTGKLSREIKNVLARHEMFWNGFDKVIIYYDNGQVELTKILSSVFNVLYTDVEFRKVTPVDYKLFQVADLVCTMELLNEKSENRSFSNSETEFFCSIRDFKKNYLKPIQKKKL